MVLRGTVAEATQGAIGFDTAIPLRAATAADYRARSYQFCIRYVSRTDASRARNAERGCADLSEEEGGLILDAGLALMVVQHVAGTGWVPNAALGADYGGKAADYCRIAGLPESVNVWLDLEDIPQGTAHADIIGYCNAWFDRVADAGYVPGVYVGFDVWLSPQELFFDLKTSHYWRAAGNIPDIAHRGYQLFQHVVKDENGHELDKDVAMQDALGGSALWLKS